MESVSEEPGVSSNATPPQGDVDQVHSLPGRMERVGRLDGLGDFALHGQTHGDRYPVILTPLEAMQAFGQGACECRQAVMHRLTHRAQRALQVHAIDIAMHDHGVSGEQALVGSCVGTHIEHHFTRLGDVQHQRYDRFTRSIPESNALPALT